MRDIRYMRHQLDIVMNEIINPLKVSAPIHSTKKLMASHAKMDILKQIDKLAAKAIPAMPFLLSHAECTYSVSVFCKVYIIDCKLMCLKM